MVLSSPPLFKQQQQQSASHWLDHQSQAKTAETLFTNFSATISCNQSLYNHRPRHIHSFYHHRPEPTANRLHTTKTTGRISVNITTDMTIFPIPQRVG